MKIRTTYEYPPIPIRSFDWSAVDNETYDGPGCAIGWGRTEQEAIEDLCGQIDGLSADEQKAQAARCGCRGSDDYCPCQNVPDAETKTARAALSAQSLEVE